MKYLYLFAVLFLAACGSTSAYKNYEGAKRNQSEISTFTFWTDQKFKGEFASYAKIYPISLDGKSLPQEGDFEVLPGQYVLVVGCKLDEVETKEEFKITAKAGKKYAVIAIVNGNVCSFDKVKLFTGDAFVEIPPTDA